MIFAPKDRLLQLCRALEELVGRTHGLEHVDVRSENGKACTLRLKSNGGAVSVLEVSSDLVTVTTRSGDRDSHAGRSEIIDRLGIDLSKGFAWNAAQCESPGELADLLVRHMHRRVKDADPHPADGASDRP